MSDRRGLLAAIWIVTWLTAGLLTVIPPAYAQYPGHIDTSTKRPPAPRAVAVLEWTGAPGKPSASRIIPITVFDGGAYQPGGLYLARPEPLAVESGTEYILQRAGVPQGLFDVSGAQDVDGYWFGYGAWRQMPPPPKVHKLQPAKILPHVVGAQNDDGRPHFANKQNPGQPGGGGNSPEGSQGSSGTTAQKDSGESASSQPPPDPDRPVLRRRSEPSSGSPAVSSNDTAGSAASPQRETAVGGADPDRPHLDYGRAEPADEDFEAPKLTGTPSGLQQMIAVSDAADREAHSFAYSWPDPSMAAKMQAQMEDLAQKALAPPAPVTKHSGGSRRKTAPVHRTRKAAASPATPLPQLTDESFKAYELTYGGSVTLVFSAQSTDATGKVKYVTLIAQPDFNETPHVIFKSVTDSDDLDLTPRMRLVDAVDPKADNRGDLIFELRGKRDRQFAIYQVAEGRAEQLFTTGPLPLSPPHGS